MNRLVSRWGLLVALVCVLVCASAAGASEAETLGEVPPPCTGANFEFGGCTVATRLGALSLSPHVVHAGGTITGTVALTGKYPIAWPTGIPFLVEVNPCTTETASCTWRVPANAPTVKYTTLQVGVTNNQGTGVSRDYYAIVGKDQFALEGHIKDSSGNPVAGVTVDISGPDHVTAKTDSTGAYNALLKRGTYTVAPNPGKGQSFAPAETKVVLNDDRTADFQLRPNQDQVTVTIESPSLPASGSSTSGIAVADRNSLGEPVEGATIRIAPPPEVTMPTLVCDSSGRLVYPTRLNDGSLLGGSFERVTDSAGEIHLSAFFGTVPGSWLMEATEVSPNSPPALSGQASATLSEAGGRAELPDALTSLLIAAGNKTLANFSQSPQKNVLEWLDQIQGEISGLAYLPIHSTDATGATQAGVVVYAGAPSVRAALMNYLEGKSATPPSQDQAVVIDIGNLQDLLLGTRLAGQAVNTVPYRLPSLAEWANGTVIEIASADQTAMHNEAHIPIPARGRPSFGMAAPQGNEDLLYGFGPYPPFTGSAAEQSSFNHCVGYTFGTRITPHSPVTVLVSDAKGEQAGITKAGVPTAAVPGSLLGYAGHALRSLSLPTGSYKVAVHGTGNGPATLVFTVGAVSSEVFHFDAHRGATGELTVTSSHVASSMRFAGHTLHGTPGLKLSVHGLPHKLRAGSKAVHLKLSLKELFGHGAGSVAVKVSGVAGKLSAMSNGRGSVALALHPRRKGTITLVFSGAGYQTLRRTLHVS
jgi:Carboxypeptidase regulatory-like domain